MVVNGAPDFEVQKSASTHHKYNPYNSRGLIKGLLKRSDVFFVRKISIFKTL